MLYQSKQWRHYKTHGWGTAGLLCHPEQPLCLPQFILPDANTGYAAGSGIFFKTTNGATGLLSKRKPGWLGSDYFTDANTGYVGVTRNHLKTTDGGTNWNVLTTEHQLLFGSVLFYGCHTALCP